MAIKETGTGRYGVEITYRSDKKNSYLEWFDTERERNRKIESLLSDPDVKRLKKKTNTELFGGSTMKRFIK